MSSLLALWLPILLSSVFVFIVSSLLHMALPWHKGDLRKLPQEDQVSAALRPFATPPGDYMLPMCSSAEMKTPEFAQKLRDGPVMLLTVMPNGPFAMGRSLVLWFAYLLAISSLSACAAIHALPAGSGYGLVFRLVAMTSFLGYAGALWQQSIWYRKSWGTTCKSTIDGLIFALVTAGTFGWLWPR